MVYKIALYVIIISETILLNHYLKNKRQLNTKFIWTRKIEDIYLKRVPIIAFILPFMHKAYGVWRTL